MSANEPPEDTRPATDDVAAGGATILDRLRSAGIGEDRARAWIAEGSVRMGGQAVTDATTPAPRPTRYTLNSP